MILYIIMENNSDKYEKRRKFICCICGDIIDKNIILISTRCDNCLYQQEIRGDKLNVSEMTIDENEKNLREL